ncbi:MAG: beta-ketoacyl-[acyl-carrier-protein] synthase II, partial [Paludibacteraceae bacterium]|nr:beta-ketoacyl-[acyl-carrier-protein] synthase II [Paludibacteraceae bacterium]
MRRVVITGMGVISPIGNDIKTFWENLKSGTCGIDFIQNIDASALEVKVAGEVKNFRAEDFGVEKGMARR